MSRSLLTSHVCCHCVLRSHSNQLISQSNNKLMSVCQCLIHLGPTQSCNPPPYLTIKRRASLFCAEEWVLARRFICMITRMPRRVSWIWKSTRLAWQHDGEIVANSLNSFDLTKLMSIIFFLSRNNSAIGIQRHNNSFLLIKKDLVISYEKRRKSYNTWHAKHVCSLWINYLFLCDCNVSRGPIVRWMSQQFVLNVWTRKSDEHTRRSGRAHNKLGKSLPLRNSIKHIAAACEMWTPNHANKSFRLKYPLYPVVTQST